MIAELGHYALVLALLVGVIQSSVPLWGAARNDAGLMEMAKPLAGVQFVLIAGSFAALTYSYLASDFSVVNVAQNSHTAKPLIYKISGVWGNHEGSLLLWVLILALFGCAVAFFGRNLPPGLRSRTLAVQGMIGVGFLLFILFTSNPFERLASAPMEGNGLNPLLQDPGLAFHPPFLYLGYVGFSIAFSFAIAALIEGKVDAAWARWVRPWTLAAWLFLTAGIALGSWWAYYELGWGGFWFWDPVENASLLPWLVGTALLHSSIVVEKRDTLKSWTILLAIIAFSLSLLGTFLVRSGVLTSVHAFATDPDRGVFILLLLVVSIGGSLALYAYRAPQLKGGGLFAPVSREGALLLNNLLLSTATATVLLGTLYPVFADALELGKVSVGPPFFNATFIPLMVPMLVALGVGPLLAWKRGDLSAALWKLKFAGVATVIVAVATFLMTGGDWATLNAVGGIALGTWLLIGVFVEIGERVRLFRAPARDSWSRAVRLPRAAWGMSLAHAGTALVVFGLSASAWEEEAIQSMQPGDSVDLGGYTFTLTEVREVPGPNYKAVRGAFQVADADGDVVAVTRPETRQYFSPPQPTTEAGIHTTGWSDLYTVVGEQDPQGGYITRIWIKPMLPFLWYGTGMMVLGGLVSLTDRRHRVGAPQRTARRKPAGHPAPAE